jgi:hypothetical protein
VSINIFFLVKNSCSNIYFQAFSPANAVFAGICVLLSVSPSRLLFATYFDTRGSQAAKDASARQDKLVQGFNRIERFFHRLEIYNWNHTNYGYDGHSH